ncbi:MAG: histidine kinase [Saprospiraceae bacterium]
MKLFWLIIIMSVVQLNHLAAQQPYARQFTDEEGLPSLTIYEITQDKEGFLWLGTSNGFCRYDGVNFIEYKSDKSIDKEFIGVYTSPTNTVWTWNISGQLFRVKGHGLELYKPNFTPESTPINKVLGDSLGNIYLSPLHWSKASFLICDTNKDSCYYQKKHPEIKEFIPFYKKIGQDNPNKIINSRGHNYHLFTQEAYSRQILNQRGLQTFNRFDFYYSQRGFIYVFNRKTRNIFKVKISNQGNLGIEDLELKTFHHPSNKDFSIRFFYEDKSENIWIIDEKQLYIFNKKNELIYQNASFFRGIQVNYFFEDKEGGFWVGTNSKGLFYIPSFQMKTLTNTKLPLNGGQIVQLMGQNDDIIGISSLGLIFKLKDNQVQNSKKLYSDFTLFKPQKYNKGYWFNSTSQGLFQLDENFNKKRIKKTKFGTIKDLDETPQNILTWYHGSITTFDKSDFETISKLKSPQKRVYAIHYNNDNQTALIGTTDGLYTFKDNEIKPFHTSHLVKPFSHWVTDITSYKDLNIIATQNNGVFFLKKNQIIEHFNLKNNLLTNHSKQLFIDDHDRLWVTSSKGLNIIDLKTMKIKTLDKTNGLPSSKINAFFSKNNQVWVSTSKGLTTFEFDEVNFERINFPITISNIKVAGESQKIQKNYTLKHNENTLSFEFISPSYKHQNDILYSYRMVGLDEKWKFTTNNSVQYDRLKPGDYQFKVRAAISEGDYNGTVKSVRIRINKSIYNTLVFYIILLVFLAIIIYIGFRIWVKFYKKRQEKEAYFNRQFSELKTSALQSQMNPHFIFNALNAIQHFFTTNDRESAMLYLGKFARLIRLIFEYSKTSAITLEQELKFLSLYLQLEKLRFGKKTQIELIGMDITGKEYILIPPLLIQPAIENALKHGLLHKEKDGELLVKFEKINEKTLRVLILDNGIGREKAKEYSAWKPKEYKSSGVQTIQERVRLANYQGGKKAIQFNIIDLKDDYNQPTGTKVEYVFKIKKIINEFEDELDE